MTIARPRTLSEALHAVGELPDAHLLAGGTDFMVEVNFGHRRPDDVVALRRVSELAGWAATDGRLRLGALLTYREMQAELAGELPALAVAARTVGSPQIRNAGTLGGNVATASPAGDTLPLLIALDAQVELASRAGTRTVALDEFITGPKQTSARPDEIVTAVHVPRVDGPQQFLKIGTRNAMVISIACLALVIDVAAQRVRCGLGSVGPTPVRPLQAEDYISGEIDWQSMRVGEAAAVRFGELTAAASHPIDDHRSTAEYRRHTVAVMARRALMRSLAA